MAKVWKSGSNGDDYIYIAWKSSHLRRVCINSKLRSYRTGTGSCKGQKYADDHA